MKIPDVPSRLTTAHVRCIFSKFTPTDPTEIHERPWSSVLTTAENLLKSKNPTSKKRTGVKIGLFGSFSSNGLAVLRKYCVIASLRQDIVAESKWLDRIDNLSDSDKAGIGKALWHKSPTTVIFKHGAKAIDVESFSYLALERYIDNMTIDICIEQFLKLAYESGKKDTLYLPSEVWQWLTCDNDFLYQKIESLHMKLEDQKLKQGLAPVHMTNHWGLVYVEVESKTMYFDDGLRLVTGQYVIDLIS
jgi:hypothetical protein